MTALYGWDNFYVIVGSSAGALIGLQFVEMTLIANMPITRGDAQAGDTFTTPTAVLFGVVLLLSAVVSAPSDGIAAVAVVCGLLGLSGVVYVVLVARRMRLQTTYQAVFEDRLFHVLLPFTAYAMLAASACAAFPVHLSSALIRRWTTPQLKYRFRYSPQVLVGSRVRNPIGRDDQ